MWNPLYYLFRRYGTVNSSILHCNSTMDCILSLLNLYSASTLRPHGLNLTKQYCVWFLLGTYVVRDPIVWVLWNLTVIFGWGGFLSWTKKGRRRWSKQNYNNESKLSMVVSYRSKWVVQRGNNKIKYNKGRANIEKMFRPQPVFLFMYVLPFPILYLIQC
jgi:hypothetical protein